MYPKYLWVVIYVCGMQNAVTTAHTWLQVFRK